MQPSFTRNLLYRLRLLFLLGWMLFLLPAAKAQVVADTFGATATGSTWLGSGPINGYDTALREFTIYNSTELAAIGIVPGVRIYALGYKKLTNAIVNSNVNAQLTLYFRAGMTYPNFSGNNTLYFFSNFPQSPTGVYYFSPPMYYQAGYTQVGAYVNGLNLSLPPAVDWVMFPLEDSFTYTGGSLEIATTWFTPVLGTATSGALSWAFYPGSTNDTRHLIFGSPPVGSLTTDFRPSLIIIHDGAAPATCTGTAAAGTITGPWHWCLGDTFKLFLVNPSAGPAVSYQWQSRPVGTASFSNIAGATSAALGTAITQAMDFRCQVICNSSGLSAYTATHNVVVDSLPVIDSVQVTNGSTGFNLVLHFRHGTNYPFWVIWNYGDGYLDSSIITSRNHFYSGIDTQYNAFAVVRTACGRDTFYFPVVIGCPGSNITKKVLASDTAFCPGETGILTAAAPFLTGFAYQWQSGPPGGLLTDIPGATSSSLTISPTVNTDYKLRAVCVKNGWIKWSDIIHTTTGPFPFAGAISETHTNLTYSFSSTGAQNAVGYKWYFGDGDSSTLASPMHTYAAQGNYAVSLVVYSDGCSDTAHIQVITGLDDLRPDRMVVRPNPSSGTFGIRVPQQCTLRVTGAEGKLIASWPLAPGDNVVTLPAGTAPGVYYGTLSAEGSIAHLTILVQ